MDAGLDIDAQQPEVEADANVENAERSEGDNLEVQEISDAKNGEKRDADEEDKPGDQEDQEDHAESDSQNLFLKNFPLPDPFAKAFEEKVADQEPSKETSDQVNVLIIGELNKAGSNELLELLGLDSDSFILYEPFRQFK